MQILLLPYGDVLTYLQPQLLVPVAAVSVFYTPDDGRLMRFVPNVTE